jgi:hypothetical protein
MFVPSRSIRTLKITSIIFSTVLLAGHTTSQALAQVPITSAQAQHLSRDLIPTDSQDFFRQGRNNLEREIQALQTRPAPEPLLKINLNPQTKKSRS